MNQIKSIRKQLESQIHMIDALRDNIQSILEGLPCNHPQEYRENISTMGDLKFRCKKCGEILEVKDE